MRGKLVVGNWKMNGGLAANARLLAASRRLARRTANARWRCACRSPISRRRRRRCRHAGVAWGAQDVSEHASGAYTGEVVGGDARGVRLPLCDGRAFGAAAVASARRTRRRREGGGGAGGGRDADRVRRRDARRARARARRDAVVLRQLDAVLDAARRGERARIVVAYEPVWAIGTGRTATPEQAQEVHALLRARLAAAGAADVPLLYGGSVKAGNAAALFAMPDIDGGLVGGASLDADEFLAIARA